MVEMEVEVEVETNGGIGSWLSSAQLSSHTHQHKQTMLITCSRKWDGDPTTTRVRVECWLRCHHTAGSTPLQRALDQDINRKTREEGRNRPTAGLGRVGERDAAASHIFMRESESTVLYVSHCHT